LFILQTITLLLPILLPGIFLVVALKKGIFQRLDVPIDNGATLFNKPLFGRNKTYRGLVIYIVGSLIVVVILWQLRLMGANWVHWVFRYDPILLGTLFGFSYALGELVNSCIKRQLGIKPGNISKHFAAVQRFFDTADGPVMATCILMLVYGFSWQSVAALISGVIIHYFSDILMFKLHMKKKH